MKRNNDWFVIALFSGGFILGPVSIDALMPALPALARHFDATIGDIQISFGIYFAGFAVGQLINGPLADRFGRRPVLLIGLIAFVLASGGALLAPNLAAFSAIRFVQGFAANTGSTVGRAVARDLSEREQAARLMSYFFGFGAAGPIIGPAVGGWLVEHIGFQTIFIMMVAFGILMVLVTLVGFRETISVRNTSALHPIIIAANFARFLKNPTFVAYTICSTLSALGVFTFLNASAPVMIEVLGVSPTEYGLWAATSMLGFMAGGLVSGRYVRRIGLDRMIFLGGILVAGAGSALLVAALTDTISTGVIVTLFAIYFFGHASLQPQTIAGALTPFPDAAGTAASLSGFVMVAGGALLSILLGATGDGTALPMAIATAFSGVGALLSYLFMVRPAQRRA